MENENTWFSEWLIKGYSVLFKYRIQRVSLEEAFYNCFVRNPYIMLKCDAFLDKRGIVITIIVSFRSYVQYLYVRLLCVISSLKTNDCHNDYTKSSHLRHHTVPEMTTFASILVIVTTVCFQCSTECHITPPPSTKVLQKLVIFPRNPAYSNGDLHTQRLPDKMIATDRAPSPTQINPRNNYSNQIYYISKMQI